MKKDDDDSNVTSDSEIIVKIQRCVILRNNESVNVVESSFPSKENNVNENDDALLTRIDPYCLSEYVSHMTEDCMAMEMDVVQCGVNAFSVNLAKLEQISVMIEENQLNCIVDSGSEMTVVRKSKIPEDISAFNKN